jgi:hypothetical protein
MNDQGIAHPLVKNKYMKQIARGVNLPFIEYGKRDEYPDFYPKQVIALSHKSAKKNFGGPEGLFEALGPKIPARRQDKTNFMFPEDEVAAVREHCFEMGSSAERAAFPALWMPMKFIDRAGNEMKDATENPLYNPVKRGSCVRVKFTLSIYCVEKPGVTAAMNPIVNLVRAPVDGAPIGSRTVAAGTFDTFDFGFGGDDDAGFGDGGF